MQGNFPRVWLEWTGGNLLTVRSARMSMQLGVRPSVCSMRVPVAAALPRTVRLSWKWKNDRFDFEDCAVIATNADVSSAVDIDIEIHDRRWKWKDGYISGHYNVRNPDGSLDAATEKTPQELATLLFTAMGETSPVITALPNTTRPEVEWDWDNPASQLEQLLESLGCDVALGLDNVVRIVKIGTGADLPEGHQVRYSLGITSDPKPHTLVAVGDGVEFQERFELEAVGLDTDGTYKLLSSLSYYPSGGFKTKNSFSEIANVTERSLAKRTVFKCYRIKQFAAGDWDLPAPYDAFTLNGPQEVLLEDGLSDYETVNGIKRRVLPYVLGNYTDEQGDYSVTSGRRLDAQFSVDTARRMIRFSEPIYKQSTTGAYEPADLYMDIAFRATDPDYNFVGQEIRYTKEQAVTDPDNELYRVYEHNDLQLKIQVPYTAVTTRDTVTSNATEINAKAQAYLDEHLAEFEGDTPQAASYHGLVPIACDGAIHTVRWSIGGSYPETLITRLADPVLLKTRQTRKQRLRERKAQVQAQRADRRRAREAARREAR